MIKTDNMNNDRKHYQRLLNTEWDMSSGHINSHVTWDEYGNFNKMAAAIEKIFDNRYGWKEVAKWRLSNSK
ncbi:MAG: hypothetical protein CMP57_02005 [Flavobacteriales bacterium]|nr:hypothetical protein [Flavobacteriales bacterium]|tara:strand:- start:124 stop:336 length:213 start_codon:yes stop_codon:yes gene_type:complete